MPWCFERVGRERGVERSTLRRARIVIAAREVAHRLRAEQFAAGLFQLLAQSGAGGAGARVAEVSGSSSRTSRRTWSSRAGACVGRALLATGCVTPSRTRGPGSCERDDVVPVAALVAHRWGRRATTSAGSRRRAPCCSSRSIACMAARSTSHGDAGAQRALHAQTVHRRQLVNGKQPFEQVPEADVLLLHGLTRLLAGCPAIHLSP